LIYCEKKNIVRRLEKIWFISETNEPLAPAINLHILIHTERSAGVNDSSRHVLHNHNSLPPPQFSAKSQTTPSCPSAASLENRERAREVVNETSPPRVQRTSVQWPTGDEDAGTRARDFVPGTRPREQENEALGRLFGAGRHRRGRTEPGSQGTVQFPSKILNFSRFSVTLNL